MGRSWTAMAEAEGRDVTLLELLSRFRYVCPVFCNKPYGSARSSGGGARGRAHTFIYIYSNMQIS